MALTKQDLEQISQLMSIQLQSQLKPIHERLDKVEERLEQLDKKIDRKFEESKEYTDEQIKKHFRG